MKVQSRVLGILTSMICLGAFLVWAVVTAPKHPIALLHVVDGAGNPVAGVVIQADGLRPKPGPYSSGHYLWSHERLGVPNNPVTTDASGVARVPYPKYVFERIETGEISFSVAHLDFVSDRPFREVTTTPPAGAPLRVWADYLWSRVRARTLIARVDPVVLQRGGTVRLADFPNDAIANPSPLYGQVGLVWNADTNFWSRPEPGVLVTRKLAAGSQAVRGVRFDGGGRAWFSEVVTIDTAAGQTNDVRVHLTPGLAVRGRLDAGVPRPVSDGRVIAHVRPSDSLPGDSSPEWHACANVREDGSFEFSSLPVGDVELIALCRGFVSKTGRAQSGGRSPQLHAQITNDVELTIEMEPTARLEVQVTDELGHPLEGVRVSTWPNIHYAHGGATILGSDCYNTADAMRSLPTLRWHGWPRPPPDFEGISDRAGLAVLRNLPTDVSEFSVDHPRFRLPAVGTAWLGKQRAATVTLLPGQINGAAIQLEPIGRADIAHY